MAGIAEDMQEGCSPWLWARLAALAARSISAAQARARKRPAAQGISHANPRPKTQGETMTTDQHNGAAQATQGTADVEAIKATVQDGHRRRARQDRGSGRESRVFEPAEGSRQGGEDGYEGEALDPLDIRGAELPLLRLVDPELLPQYLKGNVDGLEFSPGFLLAAGVLVEIFIAVVLLSRVLSYRANRRANIAAGSIMTAVQAATLFVGYQRRTTLSSALLRLRLLYSLSGMRGIGGSLSLRSSYTTRSSSQFAEEGQKRGAGRKGEVSENTLHRWRNQYGGWKVSSRSREKR